MAITLVSASIGSTPVDNGSNASSPHSGAGPASLQEGDLVVWIATKRTATGDITIAAGGSETWNNAVAVHNGSTATLSTRVFWCRIPSGMSSVSPTVTFNATTNNTDVWLVFRPSSTSKVWALDANGTNALSSFSAAATVTNNGVTPANASNVSIAIWATDDDNTWGSLSGTNWSQTNIGAQYRNTAGSDTSMAFAYQIQTSAAATNNVSLTEATNGNDPGIKGMFTFYESSANTTLSASAGSYSVTGSTTTLKRGLKCTTVAGSYSSTGSTATLSKGYKVTTVAGSYASSGNSATFSRTYILGTSAGSYSLTGSTATLAKGYKVITSAGSYSETGNSINLLKGWKTITTAGSYAGTGSTANLLWNHKISTTAGVYSLTGNSVGFRKTWQLPTVAGVYSYTGNSVNLSHGSGTTIIASTGNYLISGSNAGLRWNRILPTQAGSYTETGNSVNLPHSYVLQPSAGVYVLAGNNVTFTQGVLATYTLSPKKGGYKTTGRSAILKDVSPGPGMISMKKAYPMIPNKKFNKFS